MTGNEYVKLAMRTNDGKSCARMAAKQIAYPWIADALNGAMGLNGEAGEFIDSLKKWIFHEGEIDVRHLQKELGDVLWYVAMICNAFEWDMDTIMQMNIDKLRARYPEGFSAERSANRIEGDD